MQHKVFFLIDYFDVPYGGTEGQLYALINELSKKGLKVEMAVLKPSDYILKESFPCPVKILNINKIASFFSLLKMLKLCLYLKTHNFKLVHIYFNDASILAPFFLYLFGIKTIISRRDMGFWYSPAIKKILRFNSKFIDACICNSQAVKQLTMVEERIPSSKVHVVYNGIPEHEIYRESVPVSQGFESLIKGKKVLGLVANIRPIKRIFDLLKAAANLASDNTQDFVVVIIGDGNQTELKSLCSQLKVEDKVLFLGPQKNIAQYLKKFDVGVLTSESEGLSNAIIEYMAAGLPVVCSNVGGNPELIKHDHNGYLYEVGDIAQLTNHLNKLLENTDIAKTFGLNNEKIIQKNFTINSMVDNTLSIYKALGMYL